MKNKTKKESKEQKEFKEKIKINISKLEEEKTQVVLQLMNMDLIKGGSEYLKLKNKLLDIRKNIEDLKNSHT
jgi:hypothetical protein